MHLVLAVNLKLVQMEFNKDMQNGCPLHIKFHEESKNEIYFNLRCYPMKAEVKAE